MEGLEKDYKLIPMSQITPEAREIAVRWVEGYKPMGSINLEQKHKLASDIMNYATKHCKNTINYQCLELAKDIIKILDQKARKGCTNPSWIGYENGNGEEFGSDVEKLIDKAKKVLNTEKL